MAFWETVLGKYIMTMAIAAVPVVELRAFRHKVSTP